MVTERTEVVDINPEILGLLQFNTHKINRTTKAFDLRVEILKDLQSDITVQIAYSNQGASLRCCHTIINYIGSLKKTDDTCDNTAAVSVRTIQLRIPIRILRETFCKAKSN